MKYVFFVLCCGWLATAYALDAPNDTELLVTTDSDEQGEGTLRTVLHYACQEPDDNIIRFDKTQLPEIRIVLRSPLVIPEDCQGTVTLEGSFQVESLLDASAIAPDTKQIGDLCTLNIYSDGHTITNFSFVKNTAGAGVCVFGRENRIISNRFGFSQSQGMEQNHYGVIVYDIFRQAGEIEMNGSLNLVAENRFGVGGQYAIWVHADQATIADNVVDGADLDGVLLQGTDHIVRGNEIAECGGFGIAVEADSQDMIIGGSDFTADANVIHQNAAGGIALVDDLMTVGIRITHNRIFGNGGDDLGIDLGMDGADYNDIGDVDNGPNTRFNRVEHFQAIPLGADGPYWAWGVAFEAGAVELYTMAPADVAANKPFAGGTALLADAAVTQDTFTLAPGDAPFTAETVVTPLASDAAGNTAEYGWSAPIGADTDGDAIPDSRETGDGTGTAVSSAPGQADSDGDGLPDSVEDRNRNGAWDVEYGETAAYLADSDGDGISDWHELHGDGHYDPQFDTNPRSIDTDSDGLLDGIEDANGNGLWESHLGESNPRTLDSDGDYVPDKTDVCPAMYNPGQEPWICKPELIP